MASFTEVKQPFVLVEWNDAWKAATDNVKAEDAIHSHRPILCFTAGWLLVDNDMGVQVAAEASPEEANFRQSTFVPRAMIVKVHPVKLSKPRLKKVSQ